MREHMHPHSHISREQHTRDFTVGSPWRLIVSFAMPIFISQFFQQLYSVADAFIVGRILGTEALAAVSSTGPIIHLTTSLVIGIAMGAGVVISHAFGAGDSERVSRAIHTDIAAGLAIGAVMTVVGVAFTADIIRMIKVSDAIFPQSVEYFRVYFAGAIAVMLYNVCQSIMTSLGDSKRPLYYLIFSSFVNIALDLLFIGVLGWGVWSAAFATIVSQAASVVLCFIHLCRKGEVFTVEFKKIRFYSGVTREIMRLGMPSGIQNSVISIANVFVQAQINTFGTLATAAYGAYSKIEGFCFLPVASFTMALATFISQNLGAGKHDRAKQGARVGIISCLSVAQVIGILCYVFAPGFIALFDDNPGVIELGTMQARTVSLFLALVAFSHVMAAIFRGAGKAIFPMVVMVSIWCVFRIIYIQFVMQNIGELMYVYMAYPITWAMSGVVYIIYYFKSDWVHGFDSAEKRAL